VIEDAMDACFLDEALDETVIARVLLVEELEDAALTRGDAHQVDLAEFALAKLHLMAPGVWGADAFDGFIEDEGEIDQRLARNAAKTCVWVRIAQPGGLTNADRHGSPDMVR